MTVKELIQILNTCKPDSEVLISEKEEGMSPFDFHIEEIAKTEWITGAGEVILRTFSDNQDFEKIIYRNEE